MSFFHCCLLERKLCAEELADRVCVIKIGRWTHTFQLPGHKRRLAEMEQASRELSAHGFSCKHFTVNGSFCFVPTCGACGVLSPAAYTTASATLN